MNSIDLTLAGTSYTFLYDDSEMYYRITTDPGNEFIPFYEIVLDDGMWIDEDIVRKSIAWKENYDNRD